MQLFMFCRVGSVLRTIDRQLAGLVSGQQKPRLAAGFIGPDQSLVITADASAL